MARSRRDGVLDEKSGNFLVAILLLLPVLSSIVGAVVSGFIVTAIFVSLAYVTLLIIPLLCFMYWRGVSYARRGELEVYPAHIKNVKTLIAARHDLDAGVGLSVRKTQSGAFDERSSLGREANIRTAQIDAAIQDSLEYPSVATRNDGWDAFVKAAVVSYGALFVYLKQNEFNIFVTATGSLIGSIFIAQLWRALRGRRSYPVADKAPTSSLLSSCFVVVIWAGLIFYIYESEFGDDVPTLSNSIEATQTSESVVARQAVLEKAVAAKSMPDESSNTVWLNPGNKISILGQPDDPSWREIYDIDHSQILYLREADVP